MTDSTAASPSFLARNWRTVVLAIIVAVAAVFGGNAMVKTFAPIATDVVNTIPCTPGEVSAKCPAPAVLAPPAQK
jgi:hypothetical protein